MRERLFACASARAMMSDVDGETARTPQRSGASPGSGASPAVQETRLSSYRLAAEPLDKLSIYIALYAPDPALGELAFEEWSDNNVDFDITCVSL